LIEIYTVECDEGHDSGTFTMDYQDAKRDAQERKGKVVSNRYEFADSEMVEDFSETKETTEGATE
jgi:hypothetical protein